MIPAVVLAAGLSRRMGRFKLTLPWGETTVIGRVVAVLEAAGLTDIIVVTGHRAEEVTTAVAGTAAYAVHNPEYETGEMLSSIQAGLRGVMRGMQAPAEADEGGSRPAGMVGTAPLPPAVLLCLGDQPQMEVATVRAVLTTGEAEGWSRIVIPSYRRRAGHPILLPAWLWPEVLACTGTLRDVLARHREATCYLDLDTPTVLADLDTPEDYEAGGRKLEA
ncbi:MAG: nucleotidyltransferase family protein [Anaerolineae bacterium]|nr:nucleotidyltransferase family protein [Anaerolineae bacterium]